MPLHLLDILNKGSALLRTAGRQLLSDILLISVAEPG